MKLVLCSPSDVEIPCLDWPTALVGLMCRGRYWWIERRDALRNKAVFATLLLFEDPAPRLMVSRDSNDGAITYLTPEEIDRLMAGEDL